MLARNEVVIDELVDAKRRRLGEEDALALARQALTVIVAKGKSTIVHDMKAASSDATAIARAMLGPTGYLRAPTVRVGRTLLVGFNAEAYEKTLSTAESTG